MHLTAAIVWTPSSAYSRTCCPIPFLPGQFALRHGHYTWKITRSQEWCFLSPEMRGFSVYQTYDMRNLQLFHLISETEVIQSWVSIPVRSGWLPSQPLQSTYCLLALSPPSWTQYPSFHEALSNATQLPRLLATLSESGNIQTGQTLLASVLPVYISLSSPWS